MAPLLHLKNLTVVPIKGTIETTNLPLGSALFGRTRLLILSLLFLNDEESFYLREIIRIVKVGRGSVQRELSNLVKAGLITRSVIGNQVFYQANKEAPIFSEIKSMMVKTGGIAEVISPALSVLKDKIRIGFIYGSIVDGTDRATSDVDLLIIGKVSLRELVAALDKAQEAIGREINPIVYGVDEFREKLSAGHHFVDSVYGASKIFVIGDESELAELAEKGMVG